MSTFMVDEETPLMHQLVWIACEFSPKPQPDDPTPAEIAARCAEIQAGWSVLEERERRTGIGGAPILTVPTMARSTSSQGFRVINTELASGYGKQDNRKLNRIERRGRPRKKTA